MQISPTLQQRSFFSAADSSSGWPLSRSLESAQSMAWANSTNPAAKRDMIPQTSSRWLDGGCSMQWRGRGERCGRMKVYRWAQTDLINGASDLTGTILVVPSCTKTPQVRDWECDDFHYLMESSWKPLKMKYLSMVSPLQALGIVLVARCSRVTGLWFRNAGL